MDHLVIDTPEQIPLEFPLAGIGSRFLALAVDTIIQVAAGVGLGAIAMAAGLRGLQAVSPPPVGIGFCGAFLVSSSNSGTSRSSKRSGTGNLPANA